MEYMSLKIKEAYVKVSARYMYIFSVAKNISNVQMGGGINYTSLDYRYAQCN